MSIKAGLLDNTNQIEALAKALRDPPSSGERDVWVAKMAAFADNIVATARCYLQSATSGL